MDKLKKRITTLLLMVVMVISVLVVPITTVKAVGNSLNIDVSQIFTTTSTTVGNTFTYILAPAAATNPMPALSGTTGFTFSITGNDTVTIGPIVFTAEGEYVYTISQIVAPPVPGYTYDTEVYTLVVYVENNEATMVVYNKLEEKVDTIGFHNKYGPEAFILMVDPPIRKIVQGNPSSSSIFTFRLVAADPSFPMPEGSIGGVKTVTIKGSGQKEFGTWNYLTAGVYVYTAYEVNSGVEGYTYDTAVYTITDTVTADVNGVLSLVRVVVNHLGDTVETLDFTNVYTAPKTKKDKPPAKPFTGDLSNIRLYQIIMGISGLVLITGTVALILSYRRKNTKKANI